MPSKPPPLWRSGSGSATTGLGTTTDLLAVHTSDLHIDGRFADEFHPLCRVLETAKALGADLILLAGDVFDHNRVPLAETGG